MLLKRTYIKIIKIMEIIMSPVYGKFQKYNKKIFENDLGEK
jgi:hypothetical protein